MNAKIVLTLSLLASPLFGIDKKIALEEMRLELNDVSTQLKGQQIELELLRENLREDITSLQKALETWKEEKQAKEATDQQMGGASLEKKVASLEKSNKLLTADIKTLKDHLNSVSELLTKCEERLTTLDSALSNDIKTLKHSLQSMLGLMQPGEKTYVVQPGDSLGKIALDHKISIKTLKELNQLNSDQIMVGQKLQVSK